MTIREVVEKFLEKQIHLLDEYKINELIKSLEADVEKKTINLVAFDTKDLEYLYSKINWKDSFMDAKAIQIMNEPIFVTKRLIGEKKT